MVYTHDVMAGLSREKHAEHVIINVDASIRLARIAVGMGTCFLSELFKGATMEDELADRRVLVYPPEAHVGDIPSSGIVRDVISFA